MDMTKGKRDRLADVQESLKIAKYSESMLVFLIEHKDEKLAEIDAKIAKLQDERKRLLERIDGGPAELTVIRRQIKKLESDEAKIVNKEGRVEQYNRLKERLEKMKKEMGITD